MTKEQVMADIVHEAQDTHLCALFIGCFKKSFRRTRVRKIRM